MTMRFAIAVMLAGLLTGCQMQFNQARPDATPFAVADNDCWEFAGTPRGDPERIYTKCMELHGWTSCGPANPCRPDAL